MLKFVNSRYIIYKQKKMIIWFIGPCLNNLDFFSQVVCHILYSILYDLLSILSLIYGQIFSYTVPLTTWAEFYVAKTGNLQNSWKKKNIQEFV